MDLTTQIPVIDGRKRNLKTECDALAAALADVGCLALRMSAKDDVTPLLTAMLVRYFRQPDEVKDRDVRTNLHYQVGRTPPFTETARDRPDAIARLQLHQFPAPHFGPDPKERFMAAVGERRVSAEFPELTAPPVIPDGFPEWQELVGRWSRMALDAMHLVAEMAAVGFDLGDRYRFCRMLRGGPHLFAPTGTDLSKHGEPGTAIAAWHDDLNFLSVHGKANFPGLRVWRRDGEPIDVTVPDGCLLIQAGQQFEHLTGGKVLAGLHEVVAVEAMRPGIARCERDGVVPWRVSTTLFGHIATDEVLRPVGQFATPEANAKYPAMTAGAQVLRELKLLGLA